MRLARHVHNGVEVSGVVDGELIRPLPNDLRLLDLLKQNALADAGRYVLDQPVAVGEVRLLPPLTPPSIRDFVTFQQHVEGIARRFDATIVPEWFEAPTFYFTNPHALIGARDDVQVPPGCRVFDFELEVAAVIGRAGHDLTPARARRTSPATRSSTTGPAATSKPAR
jgi:2-keto-4-pentenoate hydratase/2-oxohepta-3-ene-1,7-dioic acid hydratase in catechol pathway